MPAKEGPYPVDMLEKVDHLARRTELSLLDRTPAFGTRTRSIKGGLRSFGACLPAPQTNCHGVKGTKGAGDVGARWGLTPSPRRVARQRNSLSDAW